MGFYLNMLRENDEMLGNTGFDDDMIHDSDDKYTVELKDVAQTIEDINADYADQSSQEELDGQDLSANPVEENAMALYEAEYNWNLIMKTIATREISEAARGREMVMESVDIKGFFTKVKDFFVKMFKKITAIVKQWLANASAMFRTNKSFVEKYGKDIDKGIDALYASGDVVKLKGYPFTKVNDDIPKMLEAIQDANAGSDEAIKKLIDVISKSDTIKLDDSQKLDITGGKEPDAIRSKFLGDGNGKVSAADFATEMKKYYLGATEKKNLTKQECKNMKIKETLESSNSTIKSIKDAYSKVKKGFESLLSSLNRLQKAMESKKSTNAGNEAIGSVTKYISKEKECKAAVQTGVTTVMRMIKIRQSQARRIGNAAIMALNKGKRKSEVDKLNGKAVGESGFFGGLDLI